MNVPYQSRAGIDNLQQFWVVASLLSDCGEGFSATGVWKASPCDLIHVFYHPTTIFLQLLTNAYSHVTFFKAWRWKDVFNVAKLRRWYQNEFQIVIVCVGIIGTQVVYRKRAQFAFINRKYITCARTKQIICKKTISFQHTLRTIVPPYIIHDHSFSYATSVSLITPL